MIRPAPLRRGEARRGAHGRNGCRQHDARDTAHPSLGPHDTAEYLVDYLLSAKELEVKKDATTDHFTSVLVSGPTEASSKITDSPGLRSTWSGSPPSQRR